MSISKKFFHDILKHFIPRFILARDRIPAVWFNFLDFSNRLISTSDFPDYFFIKINNSEFQHQQQFSTAIYSKVRTENNIKTKSTITTKITNIQIYIAITTLLQRSLYPVAWKLFDGRGLAWASCCFLISYNSGQAVFPVLWP